MKDLTGVSSKYRTIQEVLNMPGLKAKLSSYVDESVKCKQNIQFEQENLKALRENAVDELGIKPEILRNYVDMMFKNDFVQRRDKFTELADMVESVMRDANMEFPQIED